MSRLAGQIALVTGASKGIGRGIVDSLHQAGAHVIAVARPSEAMTQLITDYPERLEAWEMDATSDAVLAAIGELPKLDVLVNNLGSARHADLSETPDADIDFVIDVNLRATLRITRDAVARMGEGGSVVTITSQMGHIGSPQRVVYCATKHALEGMTKALAVELAPRGIRVNAVAPTFVRTPLTEPMLADPEFQAWVEEMIPLGRVADVEDVADAVLYLTGAKSVTGHSLLVDGGWTAR